MSRGHRRDQLREIEAVQLGASSELIDIQSSDQPDGVIAGPSKEDDVQRLVRGRLPQPAIRLGTVLHHRVPLDKAAVGHETDRHAGLK